MLEYRIESSDKYHVYKVRFEGEGKTLQAFCTCPAFKKAGLFCKHVALLLNGDGKLLIEPSDKIEALNKISANSGLLEKAKAYIPSDKKVGKKYAAQFEGDSPKTFHEFMAKSDEEAWEKAKKLAEKSIAGLKYIMDNPPEKPPEVLEVLPLAEYMEKHFGTKP